MRIYETDLLHYGLNLTTSMKKSYQCKSEDVFRVQDLNLCVLNVKNTSLSTMNLMYFKSVVLYIENIQKELERKYCREITYKELREELRRRKNIHMERMYEYGTTDK